MLIIAVSGEMKEKFYLEIGRFIIPLVPIIYERG